MIENKKIDGGKGFDWGRTSVDYAKYRDIYPIEFYEYLVNQGICTKNQMVLDIGTGTGVLPRNLYKYGAKFIGVDISENQIKQAKILANENNMDIEFLCSMAEEIDFKEETFDIVTACQCFTYFNHEIIASKVNKILKKSGKFVILYMSWLPYEDKIAKQSEDLILKYNPKWTGCRETRHFIDIPEEYSEYFEIEKNDIFDLYVPFKKETWNGRIKACRGIGASLSDEEIKLFEQEHKLLLEETAPEEFKILHYVAASILKKK